MTQPRPHITSPVLDEIRRAIQAAKDEIAAAANNSTEDGFWLAQQVAMVIREEADELARDRAVLAVELTDHGDISLARLGHMIGVSKSRAGQIVEHGRRVITGESPHIPDRT